MTEPKEPESGDEISALEICAPGGCAAALVEALSCSSLSPCKYCCSDRTLWPLPVVSSVTLPVSGNDSTVTSDPALFPRGASTSCSHSDRLG